MARRGVVGLVASLVVVLLGAQPALACGGLVGPGGTVELARTTTLAGYHDGVEHYLTSFSYAGGGTRFGSIVPLPAVPTAVAKGGDWTLPRLVRETQPQRLATAEVFTGAQADAAQELLTAKVDALDLTVLRGGGRAVGDWARERGFGLSVDAPEVLDFYAARSPIFLAASFDARRAAARGQRLGDSTAIHLTIPTSNPWVPLRILGLGHQPTDPVQADVYLLTGRRPTLLPGPAEGSGEPERGAPVDRLLGAGGVALERSEPASPQLLADLRADQGMGWLPEAGMWLSYLRVDTTAGALGHDLAVDAAGGRPSPVAAGLAAPAAGGVALPAGATEPAGRPAGPGPWAWLIAALAVAAAAVAGRVLLGRDQPAGSR
ncbi:MAG TPA: DUF2330 domain-containing protein [Actinomycetes bacterium]|nr:DUF2330 domain-containing protein [Actinomycetes bacterium]